jgi:hypothetical protein
VHSRLLLQAPRLQLQPEPYLIGTKISELISDTNVMDIEVAQGKRG